MSAETDSSHHAVNSFAWEKIEILLRFELSETPDKSWVVLSFQVVILKHVCLIVRLFRASVISRFQLLQHEQKLAAI